MKRAMMYCLSALPASGWVWAADLSNVPQTNETQAQRDERMQWFRDAKFGMFIRVETKNEAPRELLLKRLTVFGVK